jgi:hypothetical protein
MFYSILMTNPPKESLAATGVIKAKSDIKTIASKAKVVLII